MNKQPAYRELVFTMTPLVGETSFSYSARLVWGDCTQRPLGFIEGGQTKGKEGETVYHYCRPRGILN